MTLENYVKVMVSHQRFQRLLFYLTILSNWSFKLILAANLIPEEQDIQVLDNVVQSDSVSPDFKLIESVFDYQVREAVSSQPLNVNSLVNHFKLNLDLLKVVFEFLFDPESVENAFSLMPVSKTFLSAARFYMKTLLKGLPYGSDESLLPALFTVFGSKRFKEAFAGIINRPIIFKDLLEIGHSFNYDNPSDITRRALNHLRTSTHHPNSLAFSEYDHFQTDMHVWTHRAFDRLFRFNQLPYAAEMYLRANVFTPLAFFEGICEIKDNPELVDRLLERYFSIPDANMDMGQLITASVDKGNVLVLEKLLLLEVFSASRMEVLNSAMNDFLESLISKNLFSTLLLELSRSNEFSIEMALFASLKRKNLNMFQQILNSYDFDNLKWLGCKYLLSRGDNVSSFYNHRYFVDKFIKAHVDIDIFPLLMPIFDLNQVHFIEIFKKLTKMDEYDFSEPQIIEKSLIFHCAMSTANYLELLPADASQLLVSYNGRISHIRDAVNLQPGQVRFLISHSSNPVNLLYFTGKYDGTRIVSEFLHLFDLNRTIRISLNHIALNPILPNSLSSLKTANEWTLLQLAIIFHKINLIEFIVRDGRFNRSQLEFRAANRWTAIQLADEIIRFESESPYLFPCAHELERVAQLLK